MNKIPNKMIALVLAGLMLFSVCSPVFATDGELDRDHHETYDSWLGWCTSYNAALAGNVDVTVVPNTNFACYYVILQINPACIFQIPPG
ncbi:MAG: hypothetical protein IMF26_03355 [Candidatus Fermentithermobacillus carboniphilus]|uniref:Secreted protein n=1 Tax=Candidatus Fermentithermobacillus carboniphilus TaxID=3085328 RepID=A0AAT9LDM7_9FIRM|nr:MAG: hypothetical protein IMF26_03355 [Candidatus Fermentithermobacillus carboniphilus]